MKRILLFFLLTLAGLQGVSAQEFVVNPWGADELKCYTATKKGRQWEVGYEDFVMVEKGYTFQSVDSIQSEYYVFKHEGGYYAASAAELKFSSGNPAGQENPLSEEIQMRATPVGEFYGSMSAVYSIIAIYVVALLFVFLCLKFNTSFSRALFLVVVPLAILAVSAIEIYGYYLFNDKIFWWCEYERYGFWGTLLRLIPFALLVVTQLLSIKIYEPALEHELSIKPAAISLAVCVPLTIISAFAASYIDVPVETAMAVTFSVSLGIGVLITLVRNISDFGFFQGIFVTLFTIVYVISCIISVVSLISFSFKLIMMMLAVCFGLMIISGLANAKTTRTFVTKDGKTFYEV